MDHVSILMEISAKLADGDWTKGLREMLDAERKAFEVLHSKLVALGRGDFTDQDLDPLVAEYRTQAAAAKEYIVAGDNMTNKKGRKLPVEPPTPTATSPSADVTGSAHPSS
jgi:hypothetical protein